MKTTIDMAREAGGYPAAATDRALLLFSESHLERFAALVRADEREACAKVCEAEYEGYDWADRERDGAEACAAAIRARGNT
jgi:hypothetical protein